MNKPVKPKKKPQRNVENGVKGKKCVKTSLQQLTARNGVIKTGAGLLQTQAGSTVLTLPIAISKLPTSVKDVAFLPQQALNLITSTSLGDNSGCTQPAISVPLTTANLRNFTFQKPKLENPVAEMGFDSALGKVDPTYSFSDQGGTGLESVCLMESNVSSDDSGFSALASEMEADDRADSPPSPDLVSNNQREDNVTAEADETFSVENIAAGCSVSGEDIGMIVEV